MKSESVYNFILKYKNEHFNGNIEIMFNKISTFSLIKTEINESVENISHGRKTHENKEFFNNENNNNKNFNKKTINPIAFFHECREKFANTCVLSSVFFETIKKRNHMPFFIKIIRNLYEELRKSKKKYSIIVPNDYICGNLENYEKRNIKNGVILIKNGKKYDLTSKNFTEKLKTFIKNYVKTSIRQRNQI